MAVNWDQLNQPGAFERAFDSGFQLAEYGRQRREQTDQRNALSAYAIDPSEGNFNALAQHLPQVAMQQRASRDQAANEARLQDLRGRFAAGDQQAGQELARIAPSEYTSLSGNRRAYEGEMVSAASNVAQRILTLPPEQRASVYEQQMAGLSQRFPELAGQAYSDELMHETIAEAGQWQEFNRSQQPDYMAVGFDQDMVNVRDPEAVRQFGINRGAPQGGAPAPQGVGGGVPSGSPLSQLAPQQNVVRYDDFRNTLVLRGADVARQELAQSGATVAVQSPDEARTLPSGTRILLPDGSEGRVP